MGNFLNTSSEVYVIAEIGNNHNGDMDKVYKLIDAAKSAKVDCVKFQMRDLDSLYRKQTLNNEGDDLGVEYILDLLVRFDMTFDQHKAVKNYVDSIGLDYLCTPWDLPSLKKLESLGVSQYKVASADFHNIFLIDEILKKNKPVILSTGMSSEDDIELIINHLKENNAKNYALLHCNSTYPAPLDDLNLNYISVLKKLTEHVGYSGHERGINASIAAASLGSTIIERHITLDRQMEGPDHAASLTKDEFSKLVEAIRDVSRSLGKKKRIISQGELMNRENLGKSLVAKHYIKRGEIISSDDINVKSPGLGLSPLKYKALIGTKAIRDIDEDDYFIISDIKAEKKIEYNFQFQRPYGVPVRYHDYLKFTSSFKHIDFVEFHFSEKDLKKSYTSDLPKKSEIGFAVHAPELFEDSRLLDLCTDDKDYRNFSVDCMKRVIEVTNELKEIFPSQINPCIVTNIGGFSMDSNVDEDTKEIFYENFQNSISQLDKSGVNIIPQTSAPFPWHFGGQRYQNLMLDSDSIKRICKENNLEICLDVSHSALYCNHASIKIEDFISEIGHLVAHLHISDSKGTNGEGLQLNDGTSDMNLICDALNKYCKDIPFIPEIWQGHKDNGAGFAYALSELDKKL
jgi:N-acetylneuraminate synthase